MDNDRGGFSADAEAVLQEGRCHLIHVDDGAAASEKDTDIEYDFDNSAAFHTVHDLDQIDEHKAGTAFCQGCAPDGHGRYDDKGGQQSRHCVKEGNDGGGSGDVLLLFQVGAVDHGTVTGHGQGEKGLSKGKDPEPGILKSGRIDAQNILITVDSAIQCHDVESQAYKKEEKDRHHDLVGFLNTVRNAEDHDQTADRYRQDDPQGGPVGGGGRSESGANGLYIRSHGHHAPGKSQKGVFEDPSHDTGVTDRQGQRAQYRDHTHRLAYGSVSPSFLCADAERFDGTAVSGPAQGHFSGHTG